MMAHRSLARAKKNSQRVSIAVESAAQTVLTSLSSAVNTIVGRLLRALHWRRCKNCEGRATSSVGKFSVRKGSIRDLGKPDFASHVEQLDNNKGTELSDVVEGSEAFPCSSSRIKSSPCRALSKPARSRVPIFETDMWRKEAAMLFA